MSERKIRVLFAIPALDRGGPDRVVFEILSALDRSRFEATLMVSEPEGHYLSRLPTDVRVEVLGKESSFTSRYPVMAALRAVRRVAPDVIFATLRMNYTIAAIAPLLRRTRVVLRQANDFTTDFETLVAKAPVKHRLSRAISRWMLRSADAVVCQSEAMRTDLRRVLGHSANLHAIGNPVDIDAVAQIAQGPSSTIPGSPSLISTGRLWPQKGYDILLRALAIVREQYPAVHLTILGDGPDRQQLETLRSSLGLDASVTFAGYSSNVLPSVRASDVFVLASRYEGFPNAALEALACGTPVVLTDCPGANSEIVKPGFNGRLARANDASSFAQALSSTLAELAVYDRTRIIDDTRTRYGSRRIVRAYESVLSEVTR